MRGELVRAHGRSPKEGATVSCTKRSKGRTLSEEDRVPSAPLGAMSGAQHYAAEAPSKGFWDWFNPQALKKLVKLSVKAPHLLLESFHSRRDFGRGRPTRKRKRNGCLP